ncbi:hypothetical protein [Sphingobacterium thalpophilum]|uniref:hypothetical protein n=1 Tax=Sphingobacterium thalpophilum TaxID=259 RepID=UPI002D78B966|nr:hypothetical protein [Sphingobacterium thalpophilum]
MVKIPTGTKILPSKWNPEKERPIGGMKGLESIEAGSITEKLSAVRTTVENNYREHVNRFKTYPDKEIFKEQAMQSISVRSLPRRWRIDRTCPY